MPTLIPAELFHSQRPDWAMIESIGPLSLGSSQQPIVVHSDATLYFLIVEGEALVSTETESLSGEAGDVILLRAGEKATFTPGAETLRMVRIGERSNPPFRMAITDDGAVPVVLLPPAIPLPSPQRIGYTQKFDETSTFSPGLVGSSEPGDVLLYINIGALVKSQAQEIKKLFNHQNRILIGLIKPIFPDEMPEEFLIQPMLMDIATSLRPKGIGIEADITTAEGRALCERYRLGWDRRFRSEALNFLVVLDFADWDDQVLSELLGYLMATPPALLRVILRVRTPVVAPRSQRVLQILIPWLEAVEFISLDGLHVMADFMSGLGFQGWVLRGRQ